MADIENNIQSRLKETLVSIDENTFIEEESKREIEINKSSV
jgi:hypothetical protein